MAAGIDIISTTPHRLPLTDSPVKTAKNAIRVLREFTKSSPRLGVSDLARRLELDRATVHRMLRTLYEERMIDQDPDTRLYRLGSGILELAHAFVRQHGVAEVAKPELDKLRDATGETIALQVLDGKEAVCVATSESRHSVRVAYVTGERMPLHCTSSGMVFLADMAPAIRRAALSGKLQKYTSKTITDVEKVLRLAEQTSRTGIGVADESYHSGTRTLSAPVVDATGATIAAVTIAGPVQRLSSKMLMKLARPLQRTAETVSAQIAHSSSSAISK
jgi:DNA-binding IclR family transcriptional regulator